MIPTIRHPALLLFSLSVLPGWLTPAWAQAPFSFEASVRAAMVPSMDQQRASAARQAAAVSQHAKDPAPAPAPLMPSASGPGVGGEVEPVPEQDPASTADIPPDNDLANDDLGDSETQGDSNTQPSQPQYREIPELIQPSSAVNGTIIHSLFGDELNIAGGLEALRFLFDRSAPPQLPAFGAYGSEAGRIGNSDATPEAFKYLGEVVRRLSGQNGKRTDSGPTGVGDGYEP